VVACADEHERIAAAAHLILAIFDDFYAQLCEYPYRAKRAFETMDPHASIQISKERLGLYSRYIAEHGPKILAAFPALASNSIYDCRSLRGRHGIQLRPFAAPKYRPWYLAAGGLLVSAAQ
jgi:hypothetical protein